MVFVHGTSSSQGWRKRIVFYTVYRLNLIHEFTSFFSTKVIFAGMPKKTSPRKQAFVDREQGPRFSQGQPKGYYQMKELDRTTEAFADSQEKQEWILELWFGNAGPSSQADLYKSMPRSAFKSKWVCEWITGFKKWNRLRAIGY